MERNVVIESFSVSEHIAGIVNGFSSDLLIHSPSKSFVNRCETRLRLIAPISTMLLIYVVSLKAHQGLIAGTYTAEFDYDVVGTLAAARYDEATPAQSHRQNSRLGYSMRGHLYPQQNSWARDATPSFLTTLVRP